MITKFIKYNEGINHLLVGPTKEEIWEGLGYGRTFDTPEEFLEYIVDNLKENDRYLNSFYWIYIPTNEIYFEYQYNGGIFYYNSKKIFIVLHDIFDIKSFDIKKLIDKIVINKINKYLSPNNIMGKNWENIK